MQGISGNAVRVEVGMKLALEVRSALTPVWRETGFQALVLASCSAVRALLACFHHYTYHPYPGIVMGHVLSVWRRASAHRLRAATPTSSQVPNCA